MMRRLLGADSLRSDNAEGARHVAAANDVTVFHACGG
jgi:hypothetical protein